MTRLLPLALIGALAGCHAAWQLQIKVSSPTRQPIAGAALILTGCPRQNEHDNGTVTALTDANGEASVGGLGDAYPTCAVTIAKAGFVTQQTSFDQLCNGNRDDCERVQDRAITLQPER